MRFLCMIFPAKLGNPRLESSSPGGPLASFFLFPFEAEQGPP